MNFLVVLLRIKEIRIQAYTSKTDYSSGNLNEYKFLYITICRAQTVRIFFHSSFSLI